jgi:5-methyltetrahydropteroyltriglutamate--homocysteine methyltransferase
LKVSAYLHGIYPRSEHLVKATRDYQRGRASREHREEAFAADLAALVSLQQAAGLSHFTDGLLRWLDLFRPLVEACPALQAGGLSRWFDTNSFYRVPQVTGELAPALPGRTLEPATPEPSVASLPGPLLFARSCLGAPDPAGLVEGLVEMVIKPFAQQAKVEGATLFHLEEPWPVTHPMTTQDWVALRDALVSLRDGLGAPLVLHTCFGDAGPVMTELRKLPVDALGVDLVHTSIEDLGGGWDVTLVAGCLDARRSLIESPDVTAKAARLAAERTGAPGIFLTTATSLELLPQVVAASKVRTLGKAAALLREQLA